MNDTEIDGLIADGEKQIHRIHEAILQVKKERSEEFKRPEWLNDPVNFGDVIRKVFGKQEDYKPLQELCEKWGFPIFEDKHGIWINNNEMPTITIIYEIEEIVGHEEDDEYPEIRAITEHLIKEATFDSLEDIKRFNENTQIDCGSERLHFKILAMFDTKNRHALPISSLND
jgi:hypothetical protein